MDRSITSTLSSTSSRIPTPSEVSSSASMDQSFFSTLSSTSSRSSSASTSSTEDFWLQYKRNKRTTSLWKLLRSRLSPTPSVSNKSVTVVPAEDYFCQYNSEVSCQDDYEDVFEEYSNLYFEANIDYLDLPPPLPLKHHQIRAPARPPVPHL